MTGIEKLNAQMMVAYEYGIAVDAIPVYQASVEKYLQEQEDGGAMDDEEDNEDDNEGDQDKDDDEGKGERKVESNSNVDYEETMLLELYKARNDTSVEEYKRLERINTYQNLVKSAARSKREIVTEIFGNKKESFCIGYRKCSAESELIVVDFLGDRVQA